MSKLYDYIFGTSIKCDMKNYESEFEDFRTLTNIQRCERVGRVLLIAILVLILVDSTVYKPMRAENIFYLYLFCYHIFGLILILLWFAFLKLPISRRIRKKKVCYHVFINVAMYWCVFMGLDRLYIDGQALAYIICILMISAFMYITPLETFITYFTSLVVVVVGFIFIISDISSLCSHLINILVIVIFSYMVSYVNFMSFVKDFSNKKNILASKMELEETNQKLKEYESLRTDFFANISHELKTPLSVIFSAQQMIQITLDKDGYNNYKVYQYLKMVKQNSYRLIRLIGNLIDITKIDAVSFEIKLINSDIVKIVEDITMSVAGFVEDKGLDFIFDTEVEEKSISCDPDKIERIMLNLLSNAVKFTDKGGSIFVNIYIKDNKVYISVKDTGIGIPSNMKDLIFDRFVQVDKAISRAMEGSGIGLALVKSLVEMHKGNIYVNSKLGEGSEFIVALPDTMLNESEKIENSVSTVENQVERINIEFSDIYD